MQYFAVEGSDYVSNRYDFITNEADERPSANAKFGDILYCKDTGNEYIYDGSTWQEYKMRYKDLGLVIDAVNVAVGAGVYSPIIDKCHFYNGVILTYKQIGNTGTNGIGIYIHGVPTDGTLLGGIDYGNHGYVSTVNPSNLWMQTPIPKMTAVSQIAIDKKIRFGFRNLTGNTSEFTALKVMAEFVRN